MAKSNTIIVKLQSTASSYFYTTTRSSKGNKIKKFKFDPTVREYVEFTEKKIK